jgi:CSLREA domain-containing protein
MKMWLSSWFRKPTLAQHRHRAQRRRPPSRCRPGIEILENRWLPSTLAVTTSVDEVDPNDGVLSLREAIAAAKSGETINFADGVSGSALTLGQLVINKSLTIEGQSKSGDFPATGIFVGNGSSRAFDVAGSINVTFANVFINGFAYHGGGVLNEGASLALSNCQVNGTAVVSGFSGAAGNVAGGALYNAAGTVSISNSRVVGQAIAYETSSALGGGIYNAAGATLLVTNCTFSYPTFNSGSSNAVSFGGGGFSSGYAAGGAIYNAGGSVSLTNTDIEGAFTGGSTALGGAIFSSGGNLTITSCNFNSNFALADAGSTNTAAGGAIYVAGGAVQIQNSTITGNRAFSDTGGPGNDIYIAAGFVCISKNSTIGDIFGSYTIC